MEISIDSGRFIVAVSGGVDSMVLLDLLRQKRGLELVVAHFNHDIRKDSSLDELLVREIAMDYNLPIEVGHGHLDEGVSEEQARKARYDFLEEVKAKYKAKAIVTAHHQDDLIETAFINIIRGTGPRGLTAILNNPYVLRPLTDTTKEELIKYANEHCLRWREDTTNDDTKYLRNHIRKNILPLLDNERRRKFVKEINLLNEKRAQTDGIIATISQVIANKGKINRTKFALLPSEIGNELVMLWLKEYGFKNFDKKTVGRLNNTIKTALPGTKHNVSNKLWLVTTTKTAHFTSSV